MSSYPNTNNFRLENSTAIREFFDNLVNPNYVSPDYIHVLRQYGFGFNGMFYCLSNKNRK